MDDFPFSAEPWLRRVRAGDFSAIPVDLRWDDTHPGFADLLGDLHRHRARLGLPKPQVLIAKNLEVAKRTGRWPGSALEMWATLQASTMAMMMIALDLPAAEEDWVHLDSLCVQLRERLQTVSPTERAILTALMDVAWTTRPLRLPGDDADQP